MDYEENKRDLDKEISVIRDALKSAKKKRDYLQIKEGFEDGAEQIYLLYDAYKEAGFSEEQAFELVKTALLMGVKNV